MYTWHTLVWGWFSITIVRLYEGTVDEIYPFFHSAQPPPAHVQIEQTFLFLLHFICILRALKIEILDRDVDGCWWPSQNHHTVKAAAVLLQFRPIRPYGLLEITTYTCVGWYNIRRMICAVCASPKSTRFRTALAFDQYIVVDVIFLYPTPWYIGQQKHIALPERIAPMHDIILQPQKTDLFALNSTSTRNSES